MNIRNSSIAWPRAQRGMSSLVISLVLLVAITFITLYTSRGVLLESKIATNEARGRMAFECAEAGLEATIAAIAEGWTMGGDINADGLLNNSDDITGDGIGPDFRITNVVFDIDGDGTFSGNSNTTTLGNGCRTQVVITTDPQNPTRNTDLIRYNVVSDGWSDDDTAHRTIRQVLVIIPPVPNTPDSPLLARGSIVIGGAATIINPEGHSTIWTGDDVNIGSNNATKTEIADPTSANYPDCLGGSVQCETTPSSSPDVLGLDIIGNDSSLANLTGDEFFFNFLGEYPENYRKTRVDIETTNLPSLDGAPSKGQIIWQEGDISMQAGNTFGSMVEPALVIVNGDLEVSGNNFFYGMLFVTGSITGTGNLTVTGAVVVNGVGTGGGGVEVTYNSQVLNLLNMSGGRPAGSAGSWRDF